MHYTTLHLSKHNFNYTYMYMCVRLYLSYTIKWGSVFLLIN